MVDVLCSQLTTSLSQDDECQRPSGDVSMDVTMLSSSLPSTSRHCCPDAVSVTPASTTRTTTFNDVVAFVDVRNQHDNRSHSVSIQLQSLGMTVVDSLKRKSGITHVVFKGGSLSVYNRAMMWNIPIVSVSWVEACRIAGRVVDAALFPPVSKQRYDAARAVTRFGLPVNVNKMRKARSLQPRVDVSVDELIRNAGRRKKRKRDDPPGHGADQNEHQQERSINRLLDSPYSSEALRQLLPHYPLPPDFRMRETSPETPRAINAADSRVAIEDDEDDSEFGNLGTPLAIRLNKRARLGSGCVNDRNGSITPDTAIAGTVSEIPTKLTAFTAVLSDSDSDFEGGDDTKTRRSLLRRFATTVGVGSVVPAPKRRRLFNPNSASSQLTPVDCSGALSPVDESSLNRDRRRRALCPLTCSNSDKPPSSQCDLPSCTTQLMQRHEWRRRSTADFVVPRPTQSGSAITRHTDYAAICIVCTSMSATELAKVDAAITELNGLNERVAAAVRLDSFDAARITHVVVGRTRRTLTLVKGMTLGKWLVTLDWIAACRSSRQWVTETAFEVAPPFGPAAARFRTHNQAFHCKPADPAMTATSGAAGKLLASAGPIYVAEWGGKKRRCNAKIGASTSLLDAPPDDIMSLLRWTGACVITRSPESAAIIVVGKCGRIQSDVVDHDDDDEKGSSLSPQTRQRRQMVQKLRAKVSARRTRLRRRRHCRIEGRVAFVVETWIYDSIQDGKMLAIGDYVVADVD